ncbi:hypothetical protein CCMA1212_010842 [Trichoderma ghanense]|uniref:Uncharacterized protein n=1 Tax=Trichoderma ghanense TaxID=65468 RepID=A0ABY2GNP6_9HYPO
MLATIDHIDAFLRHVFNALSYVAMPGFWAEALIFWMLGLNAQTSFRMFPPADIVPDFDKTLAYSNALIMIMCIPYFQYWDRPPRSGGTLGRMLCPLTTRASPSMQFCIMLARVWLAAAWVNSGAVQFMIDHGKWKFAWRVGSLIMIL